MRLSSYVLGLFAFLAMLHLPASYHAHARGADADPLAQYRNKKRVLLLFAASEPDATYQAQLKLWKGEEAGFKERQLVVLRLLADSKSDPTGTLEKRFGVDPRTFTVILIGKDGHNAYQSKEPVTAEALFHRIDSMPMRRKEMQRERDKR